MLYSGGKDSTYAAYLAHRQGHRLVCLITIKPASPESYLFHYPNISWTRLQAETIGIPLVSVETKQVEVQDLDHVLQTAKERHQIEGVVTGGLASRYQKDRFEKACGRASLTTLSPLWQIDPETYMLDLVHAGFQVIVVAVAAEGLTEAWLGRIIDEEMIRELRELNRRVGVHIAFEGGEAETFVLDCPLFRRRIEILGSERHWYGDHGRLDILNAQLVEKTTAQKS